jgi:hypothetical protein
MNQKKSSSAGRLWVIIFIIALIEFLYIIFVQPKPQPCPVKVEGKIEDMLINIAAPITASLPEKVIVFPVDADDRTGSVKVKSGDYEQIINVSIPFYYDKNALEILKETASIGNVSFVELKGKEAQKPTKTDEEIISILNGAQDTENNLFSIDKAGISGSADQKFITIPVKFKIYKTGLYKFGLNGKLEKAKLVNSNGEEKVKIADAMFTVDAKSQAKVQILEKWNRFSQNFYIEVMDATKPEQDATKPPKVQVYPK